MANHKISVLLLLGLLLINIPSSSLWMSNAQLLPVVVDDQGGDPDGVQIYFVHVQEPNGTRIVGGDEDRERWHRSFLPLTMLASGKPRLVYSYRHAFKGFAARLTAKEVEAMSTMDGFVHAFPDEMYIFATTHTPSFLGLSGGTPSPVLWPKADYGVDTIVGVLDSGINPSHQSFADQLNSPIPQRWKGKCNFEKKYCTKKLIGAMKFKDGEKPDAPVDEVGHGTHVAGIAGGYFVDVASINGEAQGRASGTAPKARLAMYKVCNPSCPASDQVAAIDQAIRDGVDILNLSIHPKDNAKPFYEQAVAIAALAAFEKGILLCAAAGNNGPIAKTVLHDAPWILTVGASTTNRRIVSTVELPNNRGSYNGETASPFKTMSVWADLVYPGDMSTVPGAKFCLEDSLNGINVQGKIVLCWTGGTPSNEIKKGEVVKKAGGVGMILMNQEKRGSITFSNPHVLPASHVSYDGASKIIQYVETTKPGVGKARLAFQGTTMLPRPSDPAVAFLSSRGPSRVNGGILKPDIIGPGINILSAGLEGPRSFVIKSGTSMATPHLSGIAALLKANHKDWSPAWIKSAIMTSATPLNKNNQPITDQTGSRANLFAIGAGQVRPESANDPGLVYNTRHDDYIPYLCGLGYTDAQVGVVIRRTGVSCSRAGRIEAHDLNHPTISVTMKRGSKTKVQRTVTSASPATSTYKAQVKYLAPSGVLKITVSPDRLAFTGVKRTASFTVDVEVAANAQIGVLEAELLWEDNSRHLVRSPISITIE